MNYIYQSQILNLVFPRCFLQLGHSWIISLQSSKQHGIQLMHAKPNEHMNNNTLANNVLQPIDLVSLVFT